MNDTKAPVEALVLRRTFSAPRERVFAAWTQPELLKKWFGPEGFTTREAVMDVRTGGTFRITMVAPDGEDTVAKGAFTEVVAPERFTCTWIWEEDAKELEHESLLTLQFNARGGETEVVLRHEKLRNEESRGKHEEGWASTLNCLVAVL